MKGLYLLTLLISVIGLAIIDRKYKLAYYYKPRQTLIVLMLTVTCFIAWDIAGIAGDIFFIGNTNVLIGWRVSQFPIEELLFLILLSYNCLLIYIYFTRRAKKT